MKTIQEQIAVMQAFAEGKQIQISTEPARVWTDIPRPKFNWERCDYRIKPREPRVVYLMDFQSRPSYAYLKDETMPRPIGEMVEFIEVLKDNQ